MVLRSSKHQIIFHINISGHAVLHISALVNCKCYERYYALEHFWTHNICIRADTKVII